IIFAIQNIDGAKKKDTIDKFVKLNLMVKIVPPVENWIHGELNIKQIKRVRIEDLLQRDTIHLDNPKVIEFIRNKVVMVTGAAGSIGSELVHQLLLLKPDKLVLIDQAETPLFELKFELSSNHHPGNTQIEYYIADISDEHRIEAIFKNTKPSIIFHAAAYKHVPMMEDNPHEAVRVNIFGSKNIADLAVKYNSNCLVMISTDKAVRPTNVMGASKRFAEMYCQSLGNLPGMKTKFITTRFGNVLGSNGSVVKIFRNQIEAGGPVTVTHPDITRYFMTIPEACNLVLEASTMSEGSDIFIFDMGEPVKISDMARKMIRLAGFDPENEIKVEYSGLRPGEKLYEELLNSGENTLPTYHPKIMIAQVNNARHKEMLSSFEKMKDAVIEDDVLTLVGVLKDIIPDFVSNNSVFESLDKVEV
ncbi:MAG: nucleoside-diphosphate sugar epimerase/dehydratase, partial [Bacteroidota bacterium]|nr:nucleoside-diphosphate sugar epimerase/dehydratase [Bacteroidota bacterium]